MCFLFSFYILSDIIFLVIGMSKKKKLNKVKAAKSYSSDSEEMYRMLKLLVIVVLALVAFYLIFAIARGEISFGKKDEKTEPEIQNVEIVIGQIFSKGEIEYNVLMYDFDSKDAGRYKYLYDLYTSDSTLTVPLYLVDLGDKMNSDYVIEDKTKVNISSIDN